jgi:hypothetical protein
MADHVVVSSESADQPLSEAGSNATRHASNAFPNAAALPPHCYTTTLSSRRSSDSQTRRDAILPCWKSLRALSDALEVFHPLLPRFCVYM